MASGAQSARSDKGVGHAFDPFGDEKFASLRELNGTPARTMEKHAPACPRCPFGACTGVEGRTTHSCSANS
jgi:hypothetical protein